MNPHGCPPAPKAGASASSATSAHSPIDSHYSVFEKNCQLHNCRIWHLIVHWHLQFQIAGFCRYIVFCTGKIRNSCCPAFQIRNLRSLLLYTIKSGIFLDFVNISSSYIWKLLIFHTLSPCIPVPSQSICDLSPFLSL